MRAFNDTTKSIDERASERMNFRTKPHIKQTIKRAAALSGVDDSVFTMSAAYQSALATIEAHERTVLEPVDHAAFFEALDNPPQATPDLKAAFARHKDRVVSK
nr:DUF1778 domain-containing protein [uncultured Cohaesibacter sp.]